MVANSVSISARMDPIRLAKPKKSSARRKKPLWVRLAQANLYCRARVCKDLRLSSRWASTLPTVMERVAMANASINVDLPDPFSPTKKVTGVVNSIPVSPAMAGTEKG